jgi:hypothetical protein
MGYLTRYELEVSNNKSGIGILQEFRETFDLSYAIGEDGNSLQPVKWYKNEKNLLEFSLKYPEAIFKLVGYGEDKDDIWVKYFKNGDMEYFNARIVFPKCTLR